MVEALDDTRPANTTEAVEALFEVLARNSLHERTLSSVAVSGGELFIRTYKHLWCIGTK